MPDIAALHDRTQAQLDLDVALRETVADRVRAAGAARVAARTDVDALAAASADAADTEAQVRAALADADTPVDLADGEQALREALLERAGLRPGLRDARQRLAAAQVLLAGLGPVLDAARSNEALTRSRLAAADGWQHRGDAVTAPDAVTATDDLAADAAAVLASTTFADAEARVAALVPEALRDRAHARLAAADDERAWWADRADEAGASLAELLREDGPGDHDLVEATAGLETALRALENLLSNGPAVVTRAESAAARAAALDEPTSTESDRLATAAAPGAATTEQAVDDALAAWRSGAGTVDHAVLDAIEDTPDHDPVADAAVTTALEDLAALRTAVRTAVDDHDGTALGEWEVEVRPAAWASHRELVDARTRLEELADPTTASGLRDELVAASEAVAAAIEERGSAGRRLVRLSLEAAVRRADAEARRTDHAAARAERHRGDGLAGLGPSQLDPSLHATS